MANVSRTLAWPALALFISVYGLACSGGGAERAASCGALDALGVEIEAYAELLIWPGITVAPLQEATDKLEAVVLLVVGVSDGEYAADITETFALVAEAVTRSIPASLVESRPQEPAQMAARFISTEMKPLIDVHTRLIEEHC